MRSTKNNLFNILKNRLDFYAFLWYHKDVKGCPRINRVQNGYYEKENKALAPTVCACRADPL